MNADARDPLLINLKILMRIISNILRQSVGYFCNILIHSYDCELLSAFVGEYFIDDHFIAKITRKIIIIKKKNFL